MSSYTIKIPDIGEGITEVELVEWFVQAGDQITEDQNVEAVMTDKVSVEISSPVAGQVQVLGGDAGDILAVGAALLTIDLADSTENLSPSAPLAPEPTSAPATEPTLVKEQTPVAEHTTGHERLLQRVQASPAVRKRAASLSIDLEQLAQQLGKNHLNHADLDSHLAGGSSGLRPKTERVSRVTTLPIRGVRRQIAKKMQESKRTIPHFSYIEEVDVTALETWRHHLNQTWSESRGRLTLLPFLVRAICLAVKDHPEVNARYDAEQDTLDYYADVHVAIATQTEEGLKVPVLQNAQNLSLWEIASQITALTQSARAGTGSLQARSTIGLSSLGALGGVAATPIINSPEVAIVGVNKQRRMPVVIDEQIQIRTMMNLSSSFDHRFVDGMHAAQFIQTLKRMLEQPQVYLVD